MIIACLHQVQFGGYGSRPAPGRQRYL